MSSKEGQDTVAISGLFTKTTRFIRIGGSIGEGRVNTYSCPLPSPLLRPVFHLPPSLFPERKKKSLIKGFMVVVDCLSQL